MKNKMIILTFAFFPAAGVLGFGGSVKAVVNLPWSTSFNETCDQEWQWTNTYPRPWSSGVWHDTPPCYPEYDRGIDTACSGGEGEEITTAANMAAGDGGRGQRHWMGPGINDNSGGLSISFSSTQSEFWMRWYMRYESGFSWSSLVTEKWVYLGMGQTQSTVIQFHGAEADIYTHLGSVHHKSVGSGWSDVMGGSTGDGLWHCYEAHLKMDTDGSNGIGQLWIDGVLEIDYSNINYGTQSGWNGFQLQAGQMTIDHTGCKTLDVDDIVISNTGYIGPITTTDTTPPSRSNPQPTGTLTSGTTETTISLTTNETAVCKYDTASGVTFDQQQFTFDTTGTTSHSQAITNLSDGDSKIYYVRCQDTSGNANTDDFEISFNIASSATYSISNFINLVTDWLKSESGLESDVNGDGVVNTMDLGIMMSNWSE